MPLQQIFNGWQGVTLPQVVVFMMLNLTALQALRRFPARPTMFPQARF
ncbi:MAG TPA: hypothetical protein VFU70_03200 [Pseudolabrys sp.]|nr:hypothetical protein [Pseudolabrys sp.]